LLRIDPGETTADGLFSLETVNCLGACAISPALVIDDEYFSKMTNDKVAAVIGRFQGGGGGNE
jgi:NADH-quinone oxidoreductase subunit E